MGVPPPEMTVPVAATRLVSIAANFVTMNREQVEMDHGSFLIITNSTPMITASVISTTVIMATG